ncbi:MAG: nitrilase-related carbon-nitrogen hydrolase, partial [Alkalispirochaeta sp.]
YASHVDDRGYLRYAGFAMARMHACLLFIALIGSRWPLVAVEPTEPLDVVLVQYEVDPAHYATLSQFQERIDAIVAQAVADSHPDLIVFPEYTSVFALFSEFITPEGQVELERISPQVLTLLDSEDEVIAADEAHRFIRRRAQRFAEEILEIWSAVAAEHEVWILAGSGFVPAAEGGIYNRAWVFDRSGDLAYHQDKVFLTAFERENLGVVSGSVESAELFSVEGIDLALTICRDSYFDAWEEQFSEADAWIDVRANGETYSAAVRRRFNTALPERVEQTAVPLGISTSLNGRFLELFWQGPAFVVDDEGERIAESPTVDGTYLMEVEIPEAH